MPHNDPAQYTVLGWVKSIEMVSEDKLVFWTPRRRKDWPAESIVSSWFYLHPILAWMNANPDSST